MFQSILQNFQTLRGEENIKAQGGASGKFHVTIRERDTVAREVDLEAGEYTVGAAPTADLIIPNATEDELFVLRLEKRKEGASIVVVPLSNDLVARERALPVGVPVLFGDKAQISNKDIALEVFADDFAFSLKKTTNTLSFFKSKSIARLSLDRKKSHFAGALSLICIGLALALFSLSGVSAILFEGSSQKDETAKSPGGNGPTKFVLDDMQRKLTEAGLGKSLKLSLSGGALTVSGQIALEKSHDVKAAIAEISSRYGIDVNTSLKLDLDSAPFAGVAIYPKSFVITPDHKKVEVGGLLKDGSLVETITDSTIMINHDGLEFSMDF